MRVVLGHGASGNAASMKPYVLGFKRRGIDAVAVDLPKGNAERAVPVFIKTSGRGHEVIGGGQSFGGRVASMAAVEADFGGLVLFSYPLHRPGFPDQLRTEHWPRIKCPTLFMSGDRDPFAGINLLKEKIKLIPNARLVVFKGQGHGLLAVLDEALDVMADGPASGDLVLMLHGFPEGAESWAKQVDDVARAGGLAVAPDMRGYGLT